MEYQDPDMRHICYLRLMTFNKDRQKCSQPKSKEYFAGAFCPRLTLKLSKCANTVQYVRLQYIFVKIQ
jgi:hypothetical protein